MGNFSGTYNKWFWNSLSISIRILFEITAAYFLSSLKKTFLKNYEAYRKSWEDVYRILQKLRWQWNSYGVLQEFWSEYWWETLVVNRYMWYWNSLRISMRLLSGNEAVFINFRRKDVIRFHQKFRWQQNYSRILSVWETFVAIHEVISLKNYAVINFWLRILQNIRWQRNSLLHSTNTWNFRCLLSDKSSQLFDDRRIPNKHWIFYYIMLLYCGKN